ncbi:MAG: acyltransferase [Roseimicrobium sp.]
MLLATLWHHRERPRFGTWPWVKAWAKRACQLPVLLRQMQQQARLRRRGCQFGGSSFFSDVSLVSGDSTQLTVGEKTFIGRVELSVHATLAIGHCVCINDGAKLLTASHAIDDPDWRTVTAPIVVEDYCWIATNALILPGVRLGRGSVVGAGAVVSRDVPPYAVVVGNPARILTKRRPEQLRYDPTARLALMNAWHGAQNRENRSELSEASD